MILLEVSQCELGISWLYKPEDFKGTLLSWKRHSGDYLTSLTIPTEPHFPIIPFSSKIQFGSCL